MKVGTTQAQITPASVDYAEFSGCLQQLQAPRLTAAFTFSGHDVPSPALHAATMQHHRGSVKACQPIPRPCRTGLQELSGRNARATACLLVLAHLHSQAALQGGIVVLERVPRRRVRRRRLLRGGHAARRARRRCQSSARLAAQLPEKVRLRQLLVLQKSRSIEHSSTEKFASR